MFYVSVIFSRRPQNLVRAGFASCITPFRTWKHCKIRGDISDTRHLVLEFMGGGDFLMLLLHRAPLREDETRFFLAEMINGIDACHKLGFIHRDIKVACDNIRLMLA